MAHFGVCIEGAAVMDTAQCILFHETHVIYLVSYIYSTQSVE